MDRSSLTLDEPASSEDITFTPAELAGIERARARADAGLLVDFEDVEAWLDSLDMDNPLPRPEPRPKI